MTDRSKVCKGNHQGHLCVLVSEDRMDDVKALVKDSKFICFNCGRVAGSPSSVCNPMPLDD